MPPLKPLLLVLFVEMCLLLSLPAPAQAQALNVNETFNVADKEAVDGDLMVYTGAGLTRANTEYSVELFGVLQENPALVLRNLDGSGKPIVTSGNATVNVTNINGPIKKGDFITSSEIPGKGQKATKTGYVIGLATTDFNEAESAKINYRGKQLSSGQISVSLKVEFAEVNRQNNYQNPFFGSQEKLIQGIRYSAAALLILISFSLGYFTFSRATLKSVEAIGRNPLSKNAIHISLILNIVFTVIITTIGLLASIVILKI